MDFLKCKAELLPPLVSVCCLITQKGSQVPISSYDNPKFPMVQATLSSTPIPRDSEFQAEPTWCLLVST